MEALVDNLSRADEIKKSVRLLRYGGGQDQRLGDNSALPLDA